MIPVKGWKRPAAGEIAVGHDRSGEVSLHLNYHDGGHCDRMVRADKLSRRLGGGRNDIDWGLGKGAWVFPGGSLAAVRAEFPECHDWTNPAAGLGVWGFGRYQRDALGDDAFERDSHGWRGHHLTLLPLKSGSEADGTPMFDYRGSCVAVCDFDYLRALTAVIRGGHDGGRSLRPF
jgi:hypothetical protein